MANSPLERCTRRPLLSLTVWMKLARAVCVSRTNARSLSSDAASARVTTNANAKSATRRRTSSILAGRGEDLPIAVRLHGRHEARSLHLFDQARRSVVSDAQVSLH